MYRQQLDRDCQILPIKSVVYGELNEVENLLEKFDSFV
jgi:hypothetical protein